MKNTLTKTENKNGTFTYTVINEEGDVLVSRISKNGNYIACSPSGNYYFSRLDLVGKGDSGRYFTEHPEKRNEVAYLKIN
jgi:hypothetical protein